MAQGIGVSQGYKPSLYKGFTLPNVTDLRRYRSSDTTFNSKHFTPANRRYQYRNPISNYPGIYNSNNAWIKDLRSGKILYLPTIPESTEESFSTSMYSESPVGSNGPVSGFSNMGPRKISFSFDIDQSYLIGYATVEGFVNALRKLIYPTYSSGGTVNPPECSFHLVNLSIIGICDSLNVSWGSTVRKGSIDKAKISMSIVETQVLVGGSAS